MYKFNDLTNEHFGKLTVIRQNGRTKDRHIIWECVCECGNIVNVMGKDLKSGHTKSCGCIQADAVRKSRLIHGDRDARLYSVWKSMKKRCENSNHKDYKWYGAKGVIVCEEWHDYTVFKEWALESGYNENAERGECTIDRINHYGNYEPSNCRWVSIAEQNRNKRVHADMRGEQE